MEIMTFHKILKQASRIQTFKSKQGQLLKKGEKFNLVWNRPHRNGSRFWQFHQVVNDVDFFWQMFPFQVVDFIHQLFVWEIQVID